MNKGYTRHIVLEAKGHYRDYGVKKVIEKLSGVKAEHIKKSNIIDWYMLAIEDYDRDKSKILKNIINRANGIIDDGDSQDLIIRILRNELALMKVNEDGETVVDLGESDLFEKGCV